ncbi:zinc finger CCCH domain-containing protein 64-like isoform X1 [Chenopodium quinoa]|uniref:zinc finger CCCH domain-containing protein 64-like isoform X1 n=1 Tax=Chenopodium quinoa TaxID=63459 RepID=UPI000B782DFC|nr:zinc finger CCCH domain-containing protein 64-like isoform X1 [Chenopodium quinoa]
MASPPRILLSGDANGRLSQLFKRVLSVNKSAGPFDALLCVGQFFPESIEQLEEFMEYTDGRREIPIPTYFIGDYGVAAPKVLSAAVKDPGNQGFKLDGLRVCHNLYWLKGGGKFTLFGLSVAYLSGRQSPSGQQFGTYSQDDVDALRALAEEPGIVDLFLTNEWPSGVRNRIAANDLSHGISDSLGSDSTVAELVAEIKPRYHIAGSKAVFYAREPYSNVDAVHVTRFFGLAPVGNKEKQKFMHAISPTPALTMSAAEISTKPPNTTISPYTNVDDTPSTETTKRPGDSSLEEQYWRYDVKKQRKGDGNAEKLCFKFLSSGSCPREDNCHFRHDPEAREQYRGGVCFDFLNKGKCERDPDCQFKHKLVEEGETNLNKRSRSNNATTNRSKECWFCLSSPNVESHLIITVGENIYCALAKGPLVDDHVLLLPVEHSPSTLSLPPDCQRELYKNQSSLRMYCKTQRKEYIFFELISIRGTHANLQAVPIPQTKASSVKNIFNLAAKKLGFEFETIKGDGTSEARELLKAKFDGKSGFFYVELHDGTILGHTIDENENFPVQFGREVMAGLLKMPDRADWRNCKLSKDEEEKFVEDFKSRFKNFDPNEDF